MARRRLISLLLAGLAASPALAQASEPAAALFEATYQLGAETATELRNAAWASCVMFGHQQDELIRFLDEAGWSRDDEDDTITYAAPGPMADRLWMVMYEGDVSCSVIDQLTGTAEARLAFGELIDHDAFLVSEISRDGECVVEQVTLPEAIRHDGFAFTLEIISGGDFGDCTSETTSAVIIGQLE